MPLNKDQQRALDFAVSGHNLFLTGKAGTGKTFVLKYIYSQLVACGKRVAVTCTTGIACTNFPQAIQAQTIHSFSGIKDARGTKERILSTVQNNQSALQRWRDTDVLAIDEVSMLSKLNLETLDFVARKVKESEQYFGGLQVIVSGDFCQLPPVPNAWDEGNFAFTSATWGAFCHSAVLKVIVRTNDLQLLRLSNDIREGECSRESKDFADTLKRPVKSEDVGVEFIPRLYCRNDDANYDNFMELEGLEGESVTFRAEDTGNIKLLNR